VIDKNIFAGFQLIIRNDSLVLKEPLVNQ